jgi:hypothetical protein
MSFEFKPGVRYRMPVTFGPAVGPRQHPEGRPWKKEETGTMSADWMKIGYRTDKAALAELLPPGFALRGEPIVSVSCAWFRNLYWLAGRSYGILSVDFPVTYQGKIERIDGNFCPVIWEGAPDAIMTGREELGFPKMFADFTDITRDEPAGTASCEASWLGHRFFDISLDSLIEEANPVKSLPGSDGGPQLYYKYMPRTGPFGLAGADVMYAVTAAAPPGSAGGQANIDFSEFAFRRWTGRGRLAWHQTSFEQIPLAAHIVNAMKALPLHDYTDAELVSFSGPGIGVSTNGMRVIEPA